MLNSNPRKTAGFYLIFNCVSEKAYIGSSADTRRRWRQHCYDLTAGRHHCSHLQASWNIHGHEAFDFVVLGSCDSYERRLQIEDALIRATPRARRYNTFNGAVGCRHTDETKAKLSAALKGRPISLAQRAKLRAANLGKTHTAEHRAKIGAHFKGRPLSAEHRAKMSEAARSRPPVTLEARAKRRASMLKVWEARHAA